MKITALSQMLLVFSAGAALAAEDRAGGGVGQCAAPFEPAGGDYRFPQQEVPSMDIPGGTTIGEVHYTRLPIFDETNPRENNALYRWANRFHVLTRERVIARQILFEPRGEYDEKLLEETGRLLRSQGYFHDAGVRPVRHCGGEVDVEVITKDTWSFAPGASFDRSGGENTYSFSIRDSNIFGLGKQVEIVTRKDTDRTSNEFIYEDTNVLGSRVTAKTRLVNSNDGFNYLFDLGLPFFSLDSQRSWAIRLERVEREDEQFFRGDDITEVERDIDDFNLEYGFSKGRQTGVIRRWTAGYRYRKDSFQPSDELPPPTAFPMDKTMSYPYVKFEAVEDNYDTAFNLDQIYRTEDLHLGRHVLGRIGFAGDAFGSDRDRLVADGAFSDTLIYNDDILWQHGLEWEAKWNLDAGKVEDMIIGYETRYFKRITSHRSFFASLEAVFSENLNTNTQITLGGLTGARAFDNRFQVGDRRVVLTFEERVYTDIHLFNLVRVGWAVFADVGRAWEPGKDNGVRDTLLADAGFGIRLASSKAATNRVAHIDFAFPLTNRSDPAVEGFQIALNIKGTF